MQMEISKIENVNEVKNLISETNKIDLKPDWLWREKLEIYQYQEWEKWLL